LKTGNFPDADHGEDWFDEHYPRHEKHVFEKMQYGSYPEPEFEKDRWLVVGKGNWGSARPDNCCVYAADMVFTDHLGLMMLCQQSRSIVGKKPDGEEAEPRFIKGSEVFSHMNKVAKAYATRVSYNIGIGGWHGIWLFKRKGEGYKELDVEHIYDSKKKGTELTFSAHSSKGGNRTMFSTTLDVGDLLREDLHITFVRDKGKQKIYLNGIKVFQTRHGYHTEPLEMVYTL